MSDPDTFTECGLKENHQATYNILGPYSPNKNKIRFYIASFEIKLSIFAKRDKVVQIKKNKIITLITKSRSFVTFAISFFSLTIYVTQTCTIISFSDRVISYLRP